MGSNHLPVVPGLDPDVGQPVVILVRLAVGGSPLVIRARHHSDVATHPHPQIRQFGDLYPNRWIGAVRNVTRFAVGAAILNRDHKILGQERGQKIDLSFLVSCGPFFLQLADLRSGARRLWGSQMNRQKNEQAESHPRRRAESHGFYVIPKRSALTSSFQGPCSCEATSSVTPPPTPACGAAARQALPRPAPPTRPDTGGNRFASRPATGPEPCPLFAGCAGERVQGGLLRARHRCDRAKGLIPSLSPPAHT